VSVSEERAMLLGTTLSGGRRLPMTNYFSTFIMYYSKMELFSKEEAETLANHRAILALYAVSRLHGSAIKIEDGVTANLIARFSNRDRLLDVKIDLGYTDWLKPVQAPVCIFLTSLHPEGHCDPALLRKSSKWDAWSFPIELGSDGCLKELA